MGNPNVTKFDYSTHHDAQIPYRERYNARLLTQGRADVWRLRPMDIVGRILYFGLGAAAMAVYAFNYLVA